MALFLHDVNDILHISALKSVLKKMFADGGMWKNKSACFMVAVLVNWLYKAPSIGHIWTGRR